MRNGGATVKIKRIAAASAVMAAATAVILGCGGSDSGTQPADTVLRNGYVYTVDGKDSVQQAVAVRGGMIVYAGSDAKVAGYVGANTKVIDLGGRMLMPGFVDAHLHSLAGGRALLLCDLQYAPLGFTALQSKIQACLDASKDKEPDTWLEVVNWDRQATSSIDGDPTKAVLDALTTSRPIVVTSSDFHTAWTNSRGLAVAGITAATPDPAGGAFLRDAGNNPTGICQDEASFQLKAAIPADTDADLLAQGRAALDAFRQQGITSFMDAAAGDAHGKTFTALQKSGELTARVSLAINLSPADAASSPTNTIAAAKTLATRYDQSTVSATPGIRVRIVKMFMDGVVNAPADNGALLTPYYANAGTATAPNWVPGTNIGNIYYPPEVMKPLLLEAVKAGFDTHVHATGERAVRQTLDAVGYVRAQLPSADYRPAIAHDETVATADYSRFAALDVAPTMSYQWAQRASYSIGETEHHLGADRFARMEPFGSLRNAGARITYGSDWPIDPFDEFLALKIGVTRSGDPTNPHSAAYLSPDFVGPINSDPALSRADTLRSITMNSAHQLRIETVVGSIEVGKMADLIVLDKNFMQVPDEELARNRVLLTMVGGKVVLASSPFSAALDAHAAAIAGRARVLSIGASTGHAAGPRRANDPHGDGHNH